MSDHRPYTFSALLHQQVSSAAKCTTSVYQIIYYDHIFSFYTSDQGHLCYFIRAFAIFVTDHHISLKELSIYPRPFHRTDIRCCEAKISDTSLLDIRYKYGRTTKVIYWYVKESLYLACVQVHRHHTVDTCCPHQVRDQLRCYSYTWTVLTVLSGISEIRHYRTYIVSRSPAGRVNYQQQLHQIVRRSRGVLNNKHKTTSH